MFAKPTQTSTMKIWGGFDNKMRRANLCLMPLRQPPSVYKFHSINYRYCQRNKEISLKTFLGYHEMVQFHYAAYKILIPNKH